jgi:hypothetical protein
MKNLSKILMLAALAGGAGAGCVASDGSGDSTLTVSNDSSFFIDEIHLAEVSDPSWGPDLVGGSLAPGEDVTIVDIDCGTYDVLVVDETGVECELQNFDLCFDDGLWVIDDVTLDTCAFAP